MANKNLNAAKAAKNDEFYTTYGTVEEELQYYTKHFEGAVVFCNCDDPTMSNFWRFFHTGFKTLGLKKLISTHYEKDGSPSYKMEYEGGDDLDMEAGTKTPLKENGDFRSEECLEILRGCTICCTNPPFSLFRDYMNTLIENNAKFIIIGTMNSLHYKEIFPLVKNDQIWLGYNKPKIFIQPDGSEKKFGNIVWYTNLDIEKRHEKFFKPEEVHAYYEGNEDSYPVYVNAEGIDINHVDHIPIDYCGTMGVPDSFFDCYNPEDFEIIGYSGDRKYAKYMKDCVAPDSKYSTGGPSFYIQTGEKQYKRLYSRIIIKNRHPVPRAIDEAM